MSSVTEEIKSRVDLVELVGRTVPLRRVGSTFRGLCPFHTEKTPSFYVRPQTNSWHCFGCSKSGTAFDWLMEREHLEFGEALRVLANLTGVVLPEKRDPDDEEQTRRLYTILERAQTFYQGLLGGSTGARARAYLERRGLEPETINLFGLGYAATGNGLLRYLTAEGFGDQDLQAVGVIGITDDGRPYDFLRDRVLFPIRDSQGRTIAFGGRALDDSAQPKYLNTRDTLLFHKQETLFALDLARRPMAQERQAVIVEGYMDAVTAHQHGHRNVVATLGTAVTDRHLRLLRRQVDEIILALDADAAGQTATWRTLQVADESLRTGFTPVVGPTRRQQRFVPDRAVRLRVLALPGAKDPDELIRSDPAAWPTLIRAAKPVVEFVLERLGARHDLTTAEGKAAAADEIAEILVDIASPIEQDVYEKRAAEILNVESATLRRVVRSKQSHRRPVDRAAQARATEARARDGPLPGESLDAPAPSVLEVDGLDEYALALLMRARTWPEAGGCPDIDGFEFGLAQSRALARNLDRAIPVELQPYVDRVRQRLPDVERLTPPKLADELAQTRLRLQRRALERRQLQIKSLIREAPDEAEFRRLATTLGDLAQGIGAIDEQLLPQREKAGTR